jgi:hypothetical protein
MDLEINDGAILEDVMNGDDQLQTKPTADEVR